MVQLFWLHSSDQLLFFIKGTAHLVTDVKMYVFMSFSQVWTLQTYQRDCPVRGALWQSQTIWTVMAMNSFSPRSSSTQWSPPEITRTFTESSSWTRKGDAHTAYIRSVLYIFHSEFTVSFVFFWHIIWTCFVDWTFKLKQPSMPSFFI